jgi:hypothetical protein
MSRCLILYGLSGPAALLVPYQSKPASSRPTGHVAQSPRATMARTRAARGRRRLLRWSRPGSSARGSRLPVVSVNGAAPVPYVGRMFLHDESSLCVA